MTQGPRWWRYVHGRQLICPSGHHFKNVVRINDSGFVQCQHWIAAEKRECGLWVCILPIRGGRALVVEVAQDEMKSIDEQGVGTPADLLDYFGIFEPSALRAIAPFSLRNS